MIDRTNGQAVPPDDYPATIDDAPPPSLPEFGRFRAVVDNPHGYARDWKDRTGAPVVAALSAYVPREILYAGGVLPVRAYGGGQPEETVIGDEHHFRKLFCPFSRDLLAQGLLDRYDYADGVVLASTCMALRQTYESWVRHVADDDAFAHYLLLPHGMPTEGGDEFLPVKRGGVDAASAPDQSTCPHAPAEFLTEKFRELRAAVEGYTGAEITDDDLRGAIDVYDRTRTLLRELYEFRTEDEPRLSGLEAMEAVKAGHLMDPYEYNELLESALERLRDGDGTPRPTDYRLMVVTTVNDDRAFARHLEEGLEFDATIVVEEAAIGTRDFWNTVADPGGVSWHGRESEPLTDLARRYVERPPLPSKHWDRRREHLRTLVEEFDVDGAVIVQEKRCDLHHRDVPYEQRLLEEDLDVPTLTLVSDESGLPAGQLTTRLEAFVEGLRTETLEGLY